MEHAPGPIRVAVGHLSGVPGVALESPPEYISAESGWAIELRLTSTCFSDFVPEETRWVVLIDSTYPAGRIRVFPAQQGGLVHTFPHQDRNVVSRLSHATWRNGKPCLDGPSQRLGRIAGGPEPLADAEQRLRWHVERCLAWLEVAAVDQLMVDDEPFEVPQCPSELLNTRFTIVHDEGDDTWSAWDDHVGRYGEVRWAALPGFENTIVAEEFHNACGERIRASRRGTRLSGKRWVGYWWLWPSPIVMSPWHAPGTWAELRRTGETIRVDVDAFLHWMACRARDEEAVIALLGYPIPTLWNGAPMEVHWQAILPPKIPKKIKPMDGFRNNQRGRNERLRRDVFRGNDTLSYLKTANWHPDRLQARGGLPSAIRKRSVAVVGTGALGSAVAELLARGGVAKILLVDHDDLEAGNLVRHTLTGAALGHNKADAVAARLQGAAPMSQIASHAAHLPREDELQALLEPFDVVIDATGEDEVLHHLGTAWWAVPRHFLSVSLGFAARRLFLFGAQACCFPFEEFECAMRPWLDEERSQWTAVGETLEGAGCWSPLFPARGDDVWLAAVTIVKHMECAFGGEFPDGLRVLERCTDEAVGFQAIEFEEEA